MPKRGFTNARFKTVYTEVNLTSLDRFAPNTEITPEVLKEAGVVKKIENGGIKVLGKGEITKPLVVKVQAISKGAREKIEAAGGRVEVI